MNQFLVRLSLVAGLSVPAVAWAADVYVVAHSGLSLEADDVRDVFVGEKQGARGVKLTVIDNADAQPEFLAKVVKVDKGKYASMWAKKAFREGINPPAVKGGDAEVLAFVKATPGAVGYVSKPSGDVKVVQKY